MFLAYHHFFRDIENRHAEAPKHHDELTGKRPSGVDSPRFAVLAASPFLVGMLEGQPDAVQERSIEAVLFFEVPVGGRVTMADIADHRMTDTGQIAFDLAAALLLDRHPKKRMAGHSSEPAVSRSLVDGPPG